MMVAGDVGCAVWEAPWKSWQGDGPGGGAAKRNEEGGLKRR